MLNKIKYRLNDLSFVPVIMGVMSTPLDKNYDIWHKVFDKKLKLKINKNSDSVCAVDYSCSLEKYIIMNEFGSNEKSHPRIVYHFFQIECEKIHRAVFFIRMFKRHKIWINYRLFCITNPREQILLVNLKKGTNTIIIETPWAKPEDTFYIRVSPFVTNRSGEIFRNFSVDSLIKTEMLKFLYCQSNFLPDRTPLVFGVYSNDTINVSANAKIKVEISNSYTEELLYVNYFKICEKCVIDTKTFDYDDVNNGNCLCLKVSFYTKKGLEITINKYIYLYSFEAVVSNVLSESSKILLNSHSTDYDKLCIKYKMDVVEKLKSNPMKNADAIKSLCDNIRSFKEGRHLDFSIYAPLSKRVFFKSELDQSVRAYHAYVPKEYDNYEKFPLIVHFSTPELTNYSQYYINYDEPVISVDISQRGFTMGSYIGEAAIFEALFDIFKRFKIDKSRIYLLGHSNGAFAVWSIAQSYPSLIAGAMIISGSVERLGIKNLSNLKLINVSSKAEHNYFNAYKIPHKYLKDFRDSTEFLINDVCHNVLVYMLQNRRLIQEMLKFRINEYPNELEYYTRQNRHLKCYWLELRGISFGKKFAKVKAKIIDEGIYIFIQNVDEFKIIIPPQIPKNEFKIIINNTAPIVFTRYHADTVCLAKQNGRYLVNNNEVQQINFTKGMGILDVYMGKLSIIKACNEPSLQYVAEKLATPKSNGSDPNIYIRYPILLLQDFTNLPNENLILINIDYNNHILEHINYLCKVKLHSDYFEYNGIRTYGEYCIMQILVHPNFLDKHIVYIKATSSQMLLKNIFLRNFVFPTYSNGYHPYLNNDALILTLEGYFRIFEYGMDIEKI